MPDAGLEDTVLIEEGFEPRCVDGIRELNAGPIPRALMILAVFDEYPYDPR